MKLWNVPKQNDGFTLIEVVAVTVIIGIVGAIAVPNVLGQLNKSRISNGVAQIEGAFKEAQRQATSRRQSCTIQIGEVAGVVTIQNSVGNCLLETRELDAGINVANNTGNATLAIQFSAKGNIGNTANYVPANTGNWTIAVSHDDINSPKCLRIEGLFGDIQKGVNPTGAGQTLVCNTTLN